MKTNDIILPVAAFALGAFIAKKDKSAIGKTTIDDVVQIPKAFAMKLFFDDGKTKSIWTGKPDMDRIKKATAEDFKDGPYIKWFYTDPHNATGIQNFYRNANTGPYRS